ncbi:hypothetical protein [Gluconobacter sp. P1C6_b]|uniref:hypothetical protein n=1 Tax=Gluconobacter sp. P1C6_b TaxID=2762619 RepID=UPI001C04F699|nr:hypothetical protein [Gluconobacter sp. P1C6_b]
MSTNYANKLHSLQARRTGGTGGARLLSKHMAMDSRVYADSVSTRDSLATESYQVRAGNKSATSFALGAMQEVEKRFTDAALAEADRVKRYLQGKLRSRLKAEFELQGSVPMNLHIEGISDVDLLCLRTDYRTYSPKGESAKAGKYGSWPAELEGVEPADWLLELRADAERHLVECYGESSVNTKSNKSIGLSGPSFSVKVDVVPAHWYHGVEYQRSKDESDKGVSIYVLNEHKTVTNYPFRYMREVKSVDDQSNGGIKSSIRLLKNLRADSDAKGDIRLLSSYDIAALVYHLDPQQLFLNEGSELRVMARLEQRLAALCHDEAALMKLRTPDDTRYIINAREKVAEIKIIIQELKGLNEMVAEENDASYARKSHFAQDAGEILTNTRIPLV